MTLRVQYYMHFSYRCYPKSLILYAVPVSIGFYFPLHLSWDLNVKSLLICKISLIIFYTPMNNGWEAFSCPFFLMTHHLAVCSWPGLKIHWCLSIPPSSIQYEQDL